MPYMQERAASAGKVLVVEDESLQRVWLGEVLEEAGFEVLSAVSGDIALEMLAEAHDSVCAVVTDVQMPGSTDGIDLVRAVRERWPKIGVVVLSGFSQASSQFPDHTRLLHKPVNEGLLLALVRRMADTAHRDG